MTKTEKYTGLKTEQVASLQEKYGPNELKKKKGTPLIIKFLAQFKDLMVLILIFACILSFISGETLDASVILFILFLNALIGFFQEYKADKAIEALRKMVRPFARVIRDGEQKQISAQELVPGDIIILNEGDSVPADGILIETNELSAQEAILTGESLPVEKYTTDTIKLDEAIKNIHTVEQSDIQDSNKIFMGTMITHGTGKALILKTGMNTAMGKIASLTQETNKDKSPLEKEIANIGIFVGKITLVITLILIIAGLFLQHRPIIDTLIYAVSVAVAAVPEGLPTTITIALAIGVQRLSKKSAIIKQLSSVETLGATTVICTDKTGTLTKNEMTIKEILLGSTKGLLSGSGYEPFGHLQLKLNTINQDKNSTNHDFIIGKTKQNDYTDTLENNTLQDLQNKDEGLFQHLKYFISCAVLCNNAKLIEKNNTWKILGDPTEAALITLAEKIGLTQETFEEEYEKIHEFPFDSDRKRMSVIVKNKNTNQYFIFVKGAPANIFNLCTKYFDGQSLSKEKTSVPLRQQNQDNLERQLGTQTPEANTNKEVTLLPHRPITKEDFAFAYEENEKMSNQALRCLSLACKEISAEKVESILKTKQPSIFKEEIENDLIYLGLVGMMDPPREDIFEAIQLTKKAGIKVYIITGDNGLTASAIAKQIGLVQNDDYLVVHGEELDKMTDQQLKAHFKKNIPIIFARVSPEHKLRVVSTLKELKEIVAVTGDGVNDAPALKKADIGIAMGITGTDVSKEAANMILSNDSFSSIVYAIKEGRTIYQNLRKFIFYVFSSNIGEVVLIFLAIILNLPAPLSAILILFINLTTDVFPAIALGVEPAEKTVMEQPPRKTDSRILDKAFTFRVFYNGLIIGIVTLAGFLFELYKNNALKFPLSSSNFQSPIYEKAMTMTFLLMVGTELANTLNARSEKKSFFKTNFFSNPKLLQAIFLSLIISLAITQIPLFDKYFHTSQMDLGEWIFIIIGSFSIILFEELRKLICSLRTKKN